MPTINLGGWLGFGHSALHDDGLAGIFLALTGVTGAAVSLAYLQFPAGRAADDPRRHAAVVRRGRDRLRQRLSVLPGVGGDHRLRLPDRQRRPRPPRPARRLPHRRAGEDRRRGAAGRVRAAVRAQPQLLARRLGPHAARRPGIARLLFALFLVCFATKVGVLPVQGGLPAGYGSASRLGAASLSVALCAGFYGLWRFEFDVLGPLPTGCGDALLILAAVTALTGITYALTQDNLRRFLGYSTVEHAGIALVGFAVALLGHSAHMPTLGRRRPARRDPARLRAQPLKDTGADQHRPRRASLRAANDRPARRAVAVAADGRRHARGRVADARGDPAARRVRVGMVHLRSAAAGLPDADPALAPAVRAGRRRARAHRRTRAAGVRQVLQLHLPRPGPHPARADPAIALAGRRGRARDRGPVPRHGRAVGDPRDRLGPSVPARVQPRDHHAQPPAGARTRCSRTSRCSPRPGCASCCPPTRSSPA